MSKQKSKVKKKKKDIWQKYGLFVALGLTFIALSPTLLNDFVNWDDQEYVLENLFIQGLSWDNLVYLFSHANASNYHPLTMLSLAVNYSISGTSAWSYHVVNLLIHLGNVWLLYKVCCSIFTDFKYLPLVVALLFGIHPMHVESVAWISERKDVLYVLFYLLAILQYLKFTRKRESRYFIYTILFFVLSLLSKPAAITLPFILILIDWYKGNTNWKRSSLEKLPLFALALLSILVTYNIQESTAVKSYEALGFIDRLALGGTSYSIYLAKSIVPVRLNCFYAFPPEIYTWMFVALATALLFTIGWLYLFRTNKAILFGSLFFVITIGLYLHIISFGEALLAERYTYLSYVGIFIILGVLFEKLIRSQKKWIGFSLYTLALVLLTMAQSMVWKNGQSLWSNSIKNSLFDSAKPYVNLGNSLVKSGNETSALSNFEKALAIDPLSFDALNNSGIIFANMGNYPEAINRYNRALAVKTDQAETYVMRGNAHFRTNNYSAAVNDYNMAISLNPDHADAYNNRATINYNINKNYQAAYQDFSQAIRINPSYGSAFLNRSRCLYQLGRYTEALSDAQNAERFGMRVDPNYMAQIRAATGG